MFGCDVEDVMYDEAGNDALQGRDDDDDLTVIGEMII
jgi:hypothetical protein